jgi:large subunit ribosomal protein L9
MKIILLQDLKTLGKAGDVKDVAEGYARNFLFPKKIAELATEKAIQENDLKKGQEKKEEESKLESLRNLAAKLQNKKIVLRSKEKNGKLFGSISAKDIASALKKENLAIPQTYIIMNEAIKNVGEYKIEIALNPEIKTFIKLEILGEK